MGVSYKKKEQKKWEAIRQFKEQRDKLIQELAQEGIHIWDYDLVDSYRDLEDKYNMLVLENSKLKKKAQKYDQAYNKGYKFGHNDGYWEGFKMGQQGKEFGFNVYNGANSCSSYTPQEKKLLKEGFKLLALKHHPDRGGDNETMAQINNLKEKIL